jgi:MoaA/NifB/PqqE/SkfB family radical SAM enzyme
MENYSMPFQVAWDLTTKCNLRCKHCFYSSEQLGSNKMMTKEESLNFVNYLGQNKVFHLSLAGGEPLLNPNVVEIIETATKNKMVVSMATNAILLTDELAFKLKHAGLKSLQISIDGTDRETNDFIRGRGSYDKILKGLKIAVSHGFKIVVAYAIVKSNYKDVKNIFDFALTNNCYGVKIQTFISERGLGKVNEEQLILTEKETINILDEMWNLKVNYDKQLNIILPLTPNIKKIIDEQKLNIKGSCAGCQPGLKSVSITPIGDLRACATQVEEGEGIIGNVIETPLKILYQNSNNLISLRNRFKIENGNESTSCGSLCGKGCRSINLEE